jgi:hypothetical protein
VLIHIPIIYLCKGLWDVPDLNVAASFALLMVVQELLTNMTILKNGKNADRGVFSHIIASE